MKKVSMSGLQRANVGKKDAKQNREKGLVPCVVYGGKKEWHILVEDKVLGQIIFSPYPHVVELNIGGEKIKAIMQEVQYHPVTDKTLHVDFLEITDDKPIRVSLPITTKGNSPGVIKGGKLIKKLRKVKVSGLLNDIPEELVIDISKLEIGHAIRVADVKIPNVELLDRPATLVLSVEVTRAASTEETEEAEGEAAAEGETPEATDTPIN